MGGEGRLPYLWGVCLDTDPPLLGRPRPPPEADSPGHVTSDACWGEADPHTCENITFPQLRLRAAKISKMVCSGVDLFDKITKKILLYRFSESVCSCSPIPFGSGLDIYIFNETVLIFHREFEDLRMRSSQL